MGNKLLVTGATGLVGANLVRALVEQGRDVRALVHKDRRALEGLDVEIVSADVRDPAALERAIQGVDVVYHLAGSISLEMDSGQEMQAINVIGTRNVVTACLKQGVQRLIHFSSVEAVQQEPLDRAVDENNPLIDVGLYPGRKRRIPPYVLSKAQAEREVMAAIRQGLDALIIRPTAMLGPHDFKPSYLGRALIRLANHRIPALVNGGFDWVDVRDVVSGAIRAEQVATSGDIFLLSGHWYTICHVAELVAAYSGLSAPTLTVPIGLADAFAPLMGYFARFSDSQPIYTRVTLNALRSNHQVSSARAAQKLSYSARPLAETVRDTLSWFEDHDYLGVKP